MDELGVAGYEIEAWIMRLGSFPKERIAHADFSESYEMTMAHVFRLENGKYAVVVESGCSCYEPSNASIELFPTKAKAIASFKKWEKAQKKWRSEY